MDNWVDENTNGKIEEIVDVVDPINDMMFLINAIYFNGTWTYQFNEEDTKDELFYLSGGGTKECKMMEVLSEFKCFEDSNAQVIDIPYGDGNYSMTAVIPYYGEDIDQMITGLTQEKWDEWINSFSEDSVNLFFPKLKLEYKIDKNLLTVLSDMGMEIAFDPFEADFTGMYAPGNIYISRIIHKTFLELDEEGTEAAAATVVAMTLGSSEGSYPEIRLNRPFLFAIRENHSGAILFIGKIIEPVWE
ncbi:MAG: serpin family protein [candidate division WOR-3 bacterium]